MISDARGDASFQDARAWHAVRRRSDIAWVFTRRFAPAAPHVHRNGGPFQVSSPVLFLDHLALGGRLLLHAGDFEAVRAGLVPAW